MEANGGSKLLSRMVFRWTRDQEHMATHYSEELQWTTSGIQSPEKRTHRSLSHER